LTFRPHQNGATNGTLTVTDGVAFNPLVVALSGSGSGGVASPLAFSPASLSFSNVVVGTSSAKTVTVKNVSASSVNITTSASGDYKASGCSGNLPSTATCTLTVTFTPSTNGAIQGDIALANGTTVNPDVLNTSGTAIYPLTVSPTSVSFGGVTVGSASSPQTVTLTNHTAAALPLSFAASGDFTAGGGTCTGSLAGGASCTTLVTFLPTTTGNVNGVATLTYSAGYTPQEVNLTGTGQ
jgi:hypothetical protein